MDISGQFTINLTSRPMVKLGYLVKLNCTPRLVKSRFGISALVQDMSGCNDFFKFLLTSPGFFLGVLKRFKMDATAGH